MIFQFLLYVFCGKVIQKYNVFLMDSSFISTKCLWSHFLWVLFGQVLSYLRELPLVFPFYIFFISWFSICWEVHCGLNVCPLPNSCWNVIAIVTVLRGETFKRGWGHEGSTLKGGIGVIIRRWIQPSLVLSCHLRRPSPDTGILILDFSASRKWANTFLLTVHYIVSGIL